MEGPSPRAAKLRDGKANPKATPPKKNKSDNEGPNPRSPKEGPNLEKADQTPRRKDQRQRRKGLELLTLSDQSRSPVVYLLLLAFFSSLHQLLTYLSSNSQLKVVSRGLSVISTLYSTSCITITGASGTIRFRCRRLQRSFLRIYGICCDLPCDHLCCVLNLSSSF